MSNVINFPQPTFDQHLNDASQELYLSLLSLEGEEMQFPTESEIIDEVKTYLVTTDIKYTDEQQALLCSYTLCKLYGSLRELWLRK